MTFEYILLGGTLVGAIMGYMKGFLKQISSLIGLLLGYGVAALFSMQTHDFFVEKGILSPTSSLWLSFILTVGLVLLSVVFLSKLIERLLKNLGLGFTNKIAGVLLGAFKYAGIIFFIEVLLFKIGFINAQNVSENMLDMLNLLSFIVFK